MDQKKKMDLMWTASHFLHDLQLYNCNNKNLLHNLKSAKQ